MQTVSADRGVEVAGRRKPWSGGLQPADGGLKAAAPQLLLFPSVASPADVDVHAVSIAARGFTGDFYYTHRQGDRLWFALGDVAGKGLPAAVVMAMIQEELEHRIGSCSLTGCDPATTMQRLHEFLRPVLPDNRFATAVIGHLHDDGTLTLSNAGHCPPLVVRRDGTIQEIGSTGPVAGMLPSSRWHSVSLSLGRSESLILYSDGLLEARSGDGEEFGTRRIRDAVHGRTACQIAESVIGASSEFAREDDLTLLVLRREW